MSTIEDTQKVDAIGVDKSSGLVVLKIFDHLDWGDEKSHLFLLQEKINSYLRFLESGEVFDAYPASRGRRFKVHIDFLHDPVDNCLKFMEVVRGIFQSAGFEFGYDVDH